MKYLIIAGERSGDMHASKVAREIRKVDFRAEIVGVGGDYLKAEEVTLLKHYKEFSFMGIIEVIMNLRKVKKTINDLKQSIKQTAPDVLILVDFPGINLKLATYARQNNIKTCYYISPKIWAWKEHRIKRIRRDIDKMFVILPFEYEYFKSKNYEVEYVGNPLIDSIKEYNYDSLNIDSSRTNIAVLPGSRKQEIELSAQRINDIAKENTELQFHVAGVDNVDPKLYAAYKKLPNIHFYFSKTYELLKECNAAIVTSGTATLETALLNCPQVVVYRANPLSVFIARLLVKINWVSLVNLIAQKEVVKELLQEDYTPDGVMSEINKILKDHKYCASILSDYQQIRTKIGIESASKNVARKIVGWLNPELV